jgi:ferredoxin, 2Fe-2S
MPKVVYRTHKGSTHEVDVAAGRSVMLGATINGVPGIDADCGGTLSCATCHVYVDKAWADRLPPVDEVENDLLENVAAERRDNSRLSCQIVVSDALDGIVVDIPERQF